MRTPQLSKLPQAWRRGQDITATRLQETNDAVRQLAAQLNSGGQNLAPTFGGFSRLALFVQFDVSATKNDYVLADVYDGVNTPVPGENRIEIALPWFLRRDPFDTQTRAGITYTYTNQTTRDANDGTGAVEEILVPSFEVNDEISFFEVRPHTGVPIDSADLSQGYVRYLMHNAGRMWSRDSGSSGGT